MNLLTAADGPGLEMTKVAGLCKSMFDLEIAMSASGDIDVQLWMTKTGQQLTGDSTGMSADVYPEPHLTQNTAGNYSEDFHGATYRSALRPRKRARPLSCAPCSQRGY